MSVEMDIRPIGFGRWVWMVHVNGRIVSEGTSPTMALAGRQVKRAAEPFLLAAHGPGETLA